MIPWQRYTRTNHPPLHQGVLIRTVGAGPVYDVACYTGRDAGGEHRWILSDVSLDAPSITHWALIEEPEDIR